jgi:hypothetical protein
MSRRFVFLLIACIALAGSGLPARIANADEPTPVPPAATATPVPSPTPAPTATPAPSLVTPPSLAFPNATCNSAYPYGPGTTANVVFSWIPAAGAVNQFLDLSLFDNGFQDGTYVTTGDLGVGRNSFIWNGLLAGNPHFWRISSLTSAGWVSSLGYFTPCGNPVLLPIAYACTGLGFATVTFRWAPSTPAAFFQYLDLTLGDSSFPPGTFLGSGPWGPDQRAIVWPGILANRQHFWRVNEFGQFGWTPSQAGSFIAVC